MAQRGTDASGDAPDDGGASATFVDMVFMVDDLTPGTRHYLSMHAGGGRAYTVAAPDGRRCYPSWQFSPGYDPKQHWTLELRSEIAALLSASREVGLDADGFTAAMTRPRENEDGCSLVDLLDQGRLEVALSLLRKER